MEQKKGIVGQPRRDDLVFFLISVGLMPVLVLYFAQRALTTIVCIGAWAVVWAGSGIMLLSRKSEFDPGQQIVWRHFGLCRRLSIAHKAEKFEKVERILVAEGNRGSAHRIDIVLWTKHGGSKFVFSSILYPGDVKWAILDTPSLVLARALAAGLGCKWENQGFASSARR